MHSAPLTPAPASQSAASLPDLLAAYETRQPEITFEWHDPETEAVGWVVINSLRGGAAGGGTRMRKGLDRREVESLAKTMEVKFTVAGPPIGGAKSGISFDPQDPRKNGVLPRWFTAVLPLLSHYYGTGGDLNVDEIHDVIAITGEYGLPHPQAGTVRGHFGPAEPAANQQRIDQLRRGVVLPVTSPALTPDPARAFTVAALITGYGVAESVRHYYDLWPGTPVAGKRVVVQGWGNVGAAAGYYLAQQGAHIVGIIDRAGGVLSESPTGFSFAEVTGFLTNRAGNALNPNTPGLRPFAEVNERLWHHGAEVFIPAAASRLVTQAQVEALVSSGLEVIASGANVPFADQEIFFGPIADFADQRAASIPDFIANCGMARVFAYLMQPGAELTDEAIFADASQIIRAALARTRALSSATTEVARRSFEVALRQLV
ncbi:MAG: amino acid dehydrogenase [Hymenobacteraceae bacterium]|nr:amino acid dehydrogenase [Hymenobacteraceae bacterium]